VYLNLAPQGLEYLSLGSDFYVSAAAGAPEGAERVEPCAVTRRGGTAQRPLVLLSLAATREEAIALHGRELFAAGEALDALPHYRVGDLIGLRAETASGRPLGQVADVLETPVHEVLELRTPEGASVLVPLVDALVAVDAEEAVVRVVDGLLD